jgi:hypothetical protein
VFYLTLDRIFAVVFLLVAYPVALLATWIGYQSTAVSGTVAAVLFFGGYVAQFIVHAAYWKYVVKRRLTGEPRGSFPMKGSNFIERPVAAENAAALWRADVALLTSMHAELRSAVAKLKPADLEKPAHGGNETVMFLVTGVAAHDLYHAGQIQMLKRLREQ